MNSKTGQQPNEPEEREDLSTVEEFGEESGIMPTIQGRIYAFLQRAELSEAEPVFTLFKYENYVSGEGKAFLQKFEDCDPPDEQSIARLYGSGRYLLILNVPPIKGKSKGLTRTYRFRVHPAFDKSDSTTPNLPQYLPQPHTGNGMVEAFGVLEKLLVMLVPLFNRPRDENVLGILNANYTAVNDLMKKQMQDNLRVLTDYQRSIADLGEMQPMYETEQEEETTTPSIIEQFGPLIQQWIPLLMGGGPQAKAAGAMVKAVPQVQQIMKDKIQLRRIINYLDQTNGPDATDQLLAALKIQRTGRRPVQVPAPAPPPAPAAKRPVRSRKKAAAGKK